MNTARLLAWLVLPLVAVVAVGVLAIWLLKALLGLLIYVVVGALVVGGAVYLYGRARRAVAPGTRNRRRIDAATETYRTRDR
jgi:uncharacterized membrane protein SirB2